MFIIADDHQKNFSLRHGMVSRYEMPSNALIAAVASRNVKGLVLMT